MSYPPGVTGNEPQITGEYPVNPHEPFLTLDVPEAEIWEPEIYGWGVYRGNEEEPRSVHPTRHEADEVARILNSWIPDGCHFQIADQGRSGCVTCGEPDWDALFPEDDPIDRLAAR